MKKIIALTVVVFSFICAGCGFHMRSASDFPPQLKTVYFSSGKPYSALTTRLITLFQSMNIQVVKKQSKAQFSIVLSKDRFIYSRPDIVDTTLPTSINFSHSAMITVINNKNKKEIMSHYFIAAESLTLNVNQIYTINDNTLIRQQLDRKIASLIYYWLTSNNIKTALDHASSTQATQHTAQ
ncbi:MAG: hypothetical protein NTZ67_05725 [Gammaproteobacteria bacterium]|nr:hypothetical protein [Gammaproteobacteria bacterium]